MAETTHLIGLLLGGVLTQDLSWRWTLFVNLGFAVTAAAGASALLRRDTGSAREPIDVPGTLTATAGLFALVYGFAYAQNHSWGSSTTLACLVAGALLLAMFAAIQTRAAHPLLPPRVVLDRNRGGAYLSIMFAFAGMFGVFLFLTYYLQETLGYSPVLTGVAFLPIAGGIAVAANLSTIVLMPRVGPKPLVAIGMLSSAGAMTWLAHLGPHTGYAAGVLGPLILGGVGAGMVIAPSINTGTFGVAPQDAGVASATVTVGQQLGGSIGTSLLNTIFASAVTSYFAVHAAQARVIGITALTGLALSHGYDTAFWWAAGIFAVGAVVGGILFRPGPLVRSAGPGVQAAGVPEEAAEAGPAFSA